MSRVRQEAKILKNHYREMQWQTITTDDDEFEFPVSRYKPCRIMLAHDRLVKACKRRYLNDARRAKKNGDLYKLSIHKANSPYLADDAYEWWNITTE